jgi:HSP20 family molecular chaperone IbpA
MEVSGANLDNGLLHVYLERAVSERLVKTIAIE